MATEAAPVGLSKKNAIIWAITIILPLAIMLIPTNEIFTIKLKLYVAITLMGILIMAFESLNQLALAILLPVAYIVFQLAPANVVFSSWLSYIPWMMVGGLLLAEVLNGIGLLNRGSVQVYHPHRRHLSGHLSGDRFSRRCDVHFHPWADHDHHGDAGLWHLRCPGSGTLQSVCGYHADGCCSDSPAPAFYLQP